MGEWKKLITATDGIGDLGNVSGDLPSTNDTLKWNGAQWVPAEYDEDINKYVAKLFWGEQDSSFTGNNYGAIQLTTSSALYLTDGFVWEQFRMMRAGNVFTDFNYHLQVANASDVNDYKLNDIKWTFKEDNSLVDIGGTTTEDHAEDYQIQYLKEDINIPYPTDKAGTYFTEDEATLRVQFDGEIATNTDYQLYTDLSFTNPPRWGLNAGSMLLGITDAETYGWQLGEQNETHNEIWRTDMITSSSSDHHFQTTNSGWRNFVLSSTSQYLWFAVPSRMNNPGGTPTYNPKVFYRAPNTNQEIDTTAIYMGERAAVPNASSDAYSEGFKYWRTVNPYNTFFGSSIDFKITWEDA